MNAAWVRYLPIALRDRLEGSHHLQQAIGNSGWLLVDRIIRVLTGLLIGVGMARALGPSQFGKLNYAFAFVAMFSSLATLGLDGIVVRELVNAPDNRHRIMGSAFLLRTTGSILAAFLCFLSIWVANPSDLKSHVLIAILSMGFFFQNLDVIDFWFQSKVISKYAVFARFPALLIFFCVRLLLVFFVAPLTAFAWSQTLELAIAAVGLVFLFEHTGEHIAAWRPNFSCVLSMLKECWPLVFAGLSVMLYMRLDIVMLGRMSGDYSTGIYSAATRLSEGFYFVSIIVVSSFAPILLKFRARGHDQYLNTFFRLYLLMVRLSLAITGVIATLSPWLIQILFGKEFEEAAMVLRVHVWATLAVFLGVASSQYLTNEGLQKLSLYRTLTGLTVNILLNFLLIPRYGALGAAIATLISYFIATFALIFSRYGRAQCLLMLEAMDPRMIFNLSARKS